MTDFPLQAVNGLSDVRTGRNAMSNNFGWFYIHFLVSVANKEAQKLKSKYSEQFDPTYMIQPNWYCSHFAEEEFADIKSSNIIEIFEHRKEITKSALADSQKFVVKAVKGWKPKAAHSSSKHIGYNHFVISNAPYESLINDPDVLSVDAYSGIVARNRFAAGYIQSGKEELENDQKRYWVPRPLTDKGINGEGQIVGVLDSGVDIYHSFFYDSEHNLTFNKFDTSHRKIVYYDTTYADNRDHKGGHGSHVCGTLLGKSWKNNSEASLYNGVAPEAKLYFVDLGKEENEHQIEEYNDEDVANKATSKGVGIFSESYGTSVPVPSISYIADKVAWDHKELLIVAAAGNSGPDNNVASYADSINVLAVANVNSPSIQGIVKSPLKYGFLTLINKEDQNQKVNLTVISKYYGVPTNKEGELLDVDDLEVTSEATENAICLIPDAGNESIIERLNAANEKHCAFAVVENNTYNITYTFPTYACSKEQYAMLKEFQHVMYRENSTYETQRKTGEIEESSSRGPNYIGTLKPDIAAPGSFLTSAKGAGYGSKPTNDTSLNTLTTYYGTSMATPVISGSAALFRQYFMQGWYPKRTPTKNDGFTPSSSLLKAALINSASSPRNNDIGHGIPNLQQGMGFGDYGVMFVNNETIKPKEEQAYEINVIKEGQLHITLSYLDFPKLDTSFRIIMNPIHMRIEDPDGIVSEPPEEQKSFTTNSKIMITAKQGLYKLFVTSTNYDNSSIEMQYSLAIMGEIETKELKKSSTTFPKNCSSGIYENGRCRCNESIATGTYCQTTIGQGETMINVIPKNSIQWYKFDAVPKEKYAFLYGATNIDTKMRVCLSDEVDIDVNSRMSCYQFIHHLSSLINISSQTGKLYAAIYPSKYSSYFFFGEDDTPSPTTAPNDSKGDVAKGTNGTLVALIIFVILFVGLLSGVIIYFVIQRNKYYDDEKSQIREEINV